MTSDTNSLRDIEAIKRLKARYFRAMDTQQWDELRACFTEDLEADFRDAPGMLSHGRDNYLAELKPILEHSTTIHHGHMPEIVLLGANEATGVWAMDDIVILPDMTLQGWGHYHERYRREAGEWRIAAVKLTRLRLLINGEEQSLGTSANG
ncbi:MAG: nuclear transport factor 2 family protein [Halioglobus sp.]